ncbi:hypothetical protein [Streptacidiphilus neutrinimicus]|uniref:hypothetical protein n=1 Tax=Streptacidiphilus neutrinimicus TaxID=105420 RepID=UPI0005A5F145|nr:hypothetical protein [Streptacidiphilus neutrinimicus]
MNRDELNAPAALPRGHGTVPCSVDQALNAVDTYLELAEDRPEAAVAVTRERGCAVALQPGPVQPTGGVMNGQPGFQPRSTAEDADGALVGDFYTKDVRAFDKPITDLQTDAADLAQVTSVSSTGLNAPHGLRLRAGLALARSASRFTRGSSLQRAALRMSPRAVVRERDAW